jgi:Beta-propeller repeat
MADLVRNSDGSLTIKRSDRPLIIAKPVATRWIPGGVTEQIPCRFDTEGLPSSRLKIDVSCPDGAISVSMSIEWSSFVGGSDAEFPEAVSIDALGGVTVAGETWSSDFPTTPGAFDPTFNPSGGGVKLTDVFVCRFAPGGSTLSFATYLGGNNGDLLASLHVDATGVMTLTGWTASADFPTTPGAFSTSSSSTDAFVARLAADGGSLVWSTLLGGSLSEFAKAGVVASDNSVVVVGTTYSHDFPTTTGRAFAGGDYDGFVARLAADGTSLVFSTLLGGKENDTIDAVAWQSAGHLVCAGGTGSPDFPYTPGSWSQAPKGSFVGTLDDETGQILAMTAFGGSIGAPVRDAAIDSLGNIYVAGLTQSSDLPTTPDAFQPLIAPSLGAPDGYVACFDPTLSSVLHCTYLGGNLQDWITSLQVDGAGLVTVAGITNSAAFPVTPGAFTTQLHGGQGQYDAFVSRLDRKLAHLQYSTFLGGNDTENLTSGKAALDVAPDGRVAVAVGTLSPDFPVTAGAYSTTLAGSADAAVVVMDLLPAGAQKVGTSTAGCLGPLVMGVSAMAQVGSSDFAVTCTGAPPSSPRGLLLLSLAALGTPITAAGVALWVDPATLLTISPVSSDAYGYAQVPLRIPDTPAMVGLQAAGQFAWRDPCQPAGFSASNGLLVTVQP